MTSRRFLGVVVVRAGAERTTEIVTLSDQVVNFRLLHEGKQTVLIQDFRPASIEAVKIQKRLGQDAGFIEDSLPPCFLEVAEIEIVFTNADHVWINLYPTTETTGAFLVLILLNRPLGVFHPQSSSGEWFCLESPDTCSCSDILVTTLDTADSFFNPAQKHNEYTDTDILLSMQDVPQRTQMVAMVKPEFHPEPVAGFFYRTDDQLVLTLKKRCAAMREIKPMLIWIDRVPLTFIAITIDECSWLVWLNYFKNEAMKEIFEFLVKQEVLFFSVAGDSVKHDIYAKNKFRPQFADYLKVLRNTPSMPEEKYQHAQDELMRRYSLNDLLDGKADRKKFLFKFLTHR